MCVCVCVCAGTGFKIKILMTLIPKFFNVVLQSLLSQLGIAFFFLEASESEKKFPPFFFPLASTVLNAPASNEMAYNATLFSVGPSPPPPHWVPPWAESVGDKSA